MEQAGTKWNDDRLDHLSDQVDLVRDRVDGLQRHMDNRFDRLQNAMIITLASTLATFGGAIIAIRF
jgi:hypothetical protein